MIGQTKTSQRMAANRTLFGDDAAELSAQYRRDADAASGGTRIDAGRGSLTITDMPRDLFGITGLIVHTDAQAALAYSRQFRGDVRPELLLWHIARDDVHRDKALDYVARRLVFHAASLGICASVDVLAHASLDVLEMVRYQRCRVTLENRGTQFDMRKADYLELRRAGENYLMRAIRDGLRNYLMALRPGIPMRELWRTSSKHNRGMGKIKGMNESAGFAHRRAA